MRYHKKSKLKWFLLLGLLCAVLLGATLYGVFGSNFNFGSSTYRISIDSSSGACYAKNPSGDTVFSSIDVSSVVRTALNMGNAVSFESGHFNFSTTIILKSYDSVEGSGYSTVLTPLVDIPIFTINAPETRITIKNFQIMDTWLHTTTQPAIYLNNTDNIISLCTFENIQTYYYATAMATAITPDSFIDKGIVGCTFKTIYANEYTYQGFILRRVFDSKFFDIFAKAYSSESSYGFRFEYAIDSGSSINGLTVLGAKNINADGVLIDGVSNLYGTSWIADSWKEGYTFQERCDWITITSLEARSCTDQGIYLSSDSGRVTVNSANLISNLQYGVRNFGEGGHISINGATTYVNGVGDYSLVAGDSFINGYNATNNRIKDYPCLHNSGFTSITDYGNIAHGLDGVPDSISAQTNMVGIEAQVYSWDSAYFSVSLWDTTTHGYYSGTAQVMWTADKNP